MAVDPNTLLAPQGDVQPSFFPGKGRKVIAADLVTYVARAEDDAPGLSLITDSAAKDRATKLYAYYLIFTAVADRMDSEALTSSVTDKGSRGRSTKQIDDMRARAAEYLAAFDGLAPADTAIVEPVVRKVAVRTYVSF